MYRENIYEVMEKTGERVGALVVPKNGGLKGLKGYTWKVLREAGLDLEKAERVEDEKLKAGNLEVLLRRGEDIPQVVAERFKNGEIVLGLTGDDLFDEYCLRTPGSSLKVENTYDWFDDSARFRRPALCLINKSGNADDIPQRAEIALNGKYPLTSMGFLKDYRPLRGRELNPITYAGDLESAVADDGKDCCIDTVYTGGSIDKKGLKIVEIVRFSDLVVISPLRDYDSSFGRVMQREVDNLRNRKEKPTGSETSIMLQSHERMTRKLMEEAYEVVMAYYGKEGDFVAESADLMYRWAMMAVSKGVGIEAIAQEMAARQEGN